MEGCSTPRPEFETKVSSFRAAESTARVREALAFYESQAQQAEKQASANLSAKQYWEVASRNYAFASRAAKSIGDLQKSILYAEKALQTAEKAEQPVIRLNAIHRLIVAYRDVRRFDLSDEYLQRGTEILKQAHLDGVDHDRLEGLLQSEWARAFERKRNHADAAEAYRVAITSHRNRISKLDPNNAEVASARMEVVVNLSSLGFVYSRAGQLERARETFVEAFDSINEWRLKYPYEYRLYQGIGQIYRLQKQLPKALENFQKALALAAAQRSADGILAASERVGYVLRQMGKTREALPYLRQAIDHVESIRTRLQSAENRQTFFERGSGVYIETIAAYASIKEWAEAFNFSERARSRAFLDVLGTKVQLSKMATGLSAEERELNGRIAGLRSALTAGGEETDLTDLSAELLEAEKAYRDFLTKLSRENKEQASLMSVKPLTAKQVQELIDPETSLISYLVTGNLVRIWIVEKNRLQYVDVRVSKKELTDSVRQFRKIISTPGEIETFNKIANALSKRLIEPVLPYVTGKEMIIVPHDVLHYLPFHALIGSDGRYLIEKYSISYLSSASLLQFVKEKQRAAGQKILALGNPDLNDPKMSLQFAEIEAKEIQSLYPQSTVYLNKEATEEKAKTLSPQNDIIHFASHAELKEEDPLASAILLAKTDKEDGRLEVREIFGMDLKASLIVLSACETGLGKLSSGDELVGLTRAFIYAGTPSVVASLWNVEDSSTAQLMASFYKNLKTMSKVEALRQAQLALIRGQANSDLLARRGIGGVSKLGDASQTKSDPSGSLSVSTSHPYFWAPFILVGEGK